MEDGISLEFPSLKNPNREFSAHLERVNTLDSQRSQKRLHPTINLVLSQIPQFDWQSAPHATQHIDADPGAGKIPGSPATNHNPPALIPVRILRNRLDEAFTSDP